MISKFSKQDDGDDYLSEFRQKIATQKQEILEERRQDLHRARNGFIGTLTGILAAGIIGWVLILPRFSNPATEEIPVIRRPLTPVKVQPAEPGGMEILNQDKSIYNLVEKKETTGTKVESLLPQPETPKMPIIVPEPEPESSQETLSETEEAENSLPMGGIDDLIDAVQTNSSEKITIPVKPKELKLDVKVADKPAPKEEVQPKITVLESTPVNKQNDENKTKQPENKPAQSGVWQVQLMASSNRGGLETGWKILIKKHPFLKNLPHEIESPTGSDVVMYRLKAGNFKDRAEADALCAKIKAAGSGCLVRQK